MSQREIVNEKKRQKRVWVLCSVWVGMGGVCVDSDKKEGRKERKRDMHARQRLFLFLFWIGLF